MVSKRYVREDEIIGVELQKNRNSIRDSQSPTGTEKLLTAEVTEQLKVELEAAQLELTQALADAAEALAEAGLARTEAGQAVDAAAAAATQATEAYNAAAEALDKAISADGRLTVADVAPVAGDGAGKPIGALWIMRDAGIEQMWEWTPIGWVLRPLDETIIPKIAIGTGTYGDLAGDRLVARSIVAGKIKALSLTANELAANAVTAVKIAANAVIAEKIQAGAVVTDKLDALAVTTAKLAVGSVIAEKIATGAIIAGKIQAQAIDGMVITGATIRTAASGQRVQMDITGIRVFNSSGVQTTSITPGAADGGGMLIDGILEMRRNSSSPGRVYLASDGLEVTDNAGGGGKQAHVRPAELMATHQFSGIKLECPILNGVPAITLWAPGAGGAGGDSVMTTIRQYDVKPSTPRGLTQVQSGGDLSIHAMQPGSNILLWGDTTVDLRAGLDSSGKIRTYSDTEASAGTRAYKAGRLSDTPIVVMMQAYASIPVANAVPNIGTVIASTSSRQSAYASGMLSPFTPGAHSITVKEDGVYEFYIRVPIPAQATARAFVQIAGFDTDFTTEFGPGVYNMTGSWMGQLNAGDTVTFCAYQTTGAARTVTSIIRAAYLGPKT